MNALIQAVRNANVQAVANALANYADIESVNNNGRNAMYYAERINLGIPRGRIQNLLETSGYLDELEEELKDELFGERLASFDDKLQSLRSAVYTTALNYEEPGDYAFAIYTIVKDIATAAREEVIGNGATASVANDSALNAAIANAQYFIYEDRLDDALDILHQRREGENGIVNENNNANNEGAAIAEAEEEFNAIQAAHAAQVAANTNEGAIANVPSLTNNGNGENENIPVSTNLNEENPGQLGGRRLKRFTKKIQRKKQKKTRKQTKTRTKKQAKQRKH